MLLELVAPDILAGVMTNTTDNIATSLRTKSLEELEALTLELRQELIEKISQSGGHFASSLGAAEISVALHYVFNTPQDRLVWDVGHQAYIHKMLTGRRDDISAIRTHGGISGFLKREESPFDCFGAGHAGTSISAAVGMATALRESDPSRKVVAVIGDGSMTAGMAFEALNHAGGLGLKNLIVVLNDNQMSISPNVGAISWLFSRAVTSKLSTKVRSKFKALYRNGLFPKVVYQAIDRIEELTQGFISAPALLFESFGFRYIGPVDGHNLGDLIKALEHAKDQDVPVIVHAATLKGKGYEPAEEDPIKWHGVTPFDPQLGKFHAANKVAAPSYTNVFADTLIKIADQDRRVVAITAAMLGGTGLDRFAQSHPGRCYDVGICEQHAVTFAGGLACEGLKPVCAIYSTFLQRAYDQVVHDVCIQNLPVVFAIDRAGLVGNDGETHQGAFDIAYMRSIPNMVIMSPKDENELQHMLFTASQYNAPIALRYPRGNGKGVQLDQNLKCLPIGKAEMLTEGEDVLLIALGPIVSYAEIVAEKLKEMGHSVSIMNARFAKPLDESLLIEQLNKDFKVVATLEDHAVAAGFGSAILELISDKEIKIKGSLIRFGIQDAFVPHANQAQQHAFNSYDPDSILEVIQEHLPLRVLAGNVKE